MPSKCVVDQFQLEGGRGTKEIRKNKKRTEDLCSKNGVGGKLISKQGGIKYTTFDCRFECATISRKIVQLRRNLLKSE